MRSMDLNADLGEGGSEDAVLLTLVTSANIACGGHAGSDEIMRHTVELALASGVKIGAHPGYEDRENFGRREMDLPLDAVTDLVARQVGKLAGFAGAQLHHVKPHGALYNQADRNPELAAAVVAGVKRISPDLILYAPPAGKLAAAGRAAGLTVMAEGFADRRYCPDGSLVPRTEPGAVITDIVEAVAQSLELARSGLIETICVHGDGAQAVEMLRAVRKALVVARPHFPMQSKAKTVDEYLDEIPADRRTALVTLRALIKKEVPDVVESMMYGMPAYQIHGRLFGMASQKQNMAFYCCDAIMEKYHTALAHLNCGKSCIRFRRLEDLPLEVISNLLRDAASRSE